jgi:hypothetical protein
MGRMGMKVLAVVLFLVGVALAFLCMGVLIELGAPPWTHVLPIAAIAAIARPLAKFVEGK